MLVKADEDDYNAIEVMEVMTGLAKKGIMIIMITLLGEHRPFSVDRRSHVLSVV